MKRITCLLILIVMLISVSCSNKNNAVVRDDTDNGGIAGNAETSNDDITIIENERYKIKEDIPVSDFGGYEFRILTRDSDHHLKEVLAETENGETINDAVYYRNRAIEEKLNINIKIITTPEVTEAELITFFTASVMANDDTFDLALPHTVNAGIAATHGIMYDWRSVPYIDFKKPWWNDVIVNELTVNGKLFLAISDFCISAIDYTWVMLYNYQMGADYEVPNLYDIIKTGNWTIDKFHGYVKNVSADIDGDGIFDYKDLYGFTTHYNSAIQNWMFALDQKVTKMNADGYPELIINNEKMVSIVEKLYDILYNGNNTLIVNETVTKAYNVDLHDKAVAKKFEAEETMFAAIRTLYIDLLRNMRSEYGIIPFPKYDAD